MVVSKPALTMVVTAAGCCLWLAFNGPIAGRAAPRMGRVVAMRLQAVPVNYSGGCPATIHFNGFIRVDGPNTVAYGFVRSDGARDTEPQRVHFKAAGTQRVGWSWRLGRPGEIYNGWAMMRSGNTQSNRAVFHLHCR